MPCVTLYGVCGRVPGSPTLLTIGEVGILVPATRRGMHPIETRYSFRPRRCSFGERPRPTLPRPGGSAPW